MFQSKLCFPACAINNEGILYYVTHIEQAIKKINIESAEVSYIANPEGYIPKEWIGVDKLVINENKLYLFEQNGEKLLEYSLTDKIGRCFNLNNNMNDCDNWAIAVVYNNSVFAFSSFANKLIKINLESEEVEEIEGLCPNIDYLFRQEKTYYISDGIKIEILHKLYSCGCQIDNDIWLFTERKGIVLKFNLLTERCVQYRIPSDIKGCIHVLWKDGLFYILSLESNLYSWNIETNAIEKIFDSENKYNYPYFRGIAITDENIWMLPGLGKDICIVNLKNGEHNLYMPYPEDFCYCEDPIMSKYFGYSDDKKNYYFAMHSANYILIIEKATGKGKWIRPIEPDLSEKVRYYKDFNMQEYDEPYFGLEGLFMLLGQKENTFVERENIKNGKKIWSGLK